MQQAAQLLKIKSAMQFFDRFFPFEIGVSFINDFRITFAFFFSIRFFASIEFCCCCCFCALCAFYLFIYLYFVLKIFLFCILSLNCFFIHCCIYTFLPLHCQGTHFLQVCANQCVFVFLFFLSCFLSVVVVVVVVVQIRYKWAIDWRSAFLSKRRVNERAWCIYGNGFVRRHLKIFTFT